jgi:dephospho-CoA kinase
MKIGLTGGIGSGKSTVGSLFSELGITVIDADQLTRQLVEPNQPAYHAIVKQFGLSILKSDNTIDRAKLRHLIYQDAHAKKWLEALLHPLVRELMSKQATTSSSSYTILMIPLLLESQFNPLIDRILVVDCDEKTQIARVKSRDHLSEEEIKKIIACQIPRTERLKKADDVITNSTDLNSLKNQTTKLHLFYLSLCHKK